MTATDKLRNSIVEKLLTISDKNYLNALNNIVGQSKIDNSKAKLSKEQILMLRLSDQDIKNGRLKSQSQLDKDDMAWLSEQ